MLDWDSIYKSGKDFGTLPENVVDLILSHTDKTASKTFLDIGCGTGQLTRLLYKKGYICQGIDASVEAVKIASNRSTDIQYDVLDIQKEPIGGLHGPYGLIACKHVYAFIPDTNLFLSKVSRLLEETGTFVLITPLRENESEDKRKISVSGIDLRSDISRHLSITLDTPLKSGQLFLLQKKE